MFSNMFKSWFAAASANYNEFIKALLNGDVKAMNLYMNDIALATFSNFDAGKHASERSQPERFYHGFVLGLLGKCEIFMRCVPIGKVGMEDTM